MLLKKLIASTLALSIISISTITVDAATLTRTIDNDSIASGYGNKNENNAYWYITSNSLYNGDARITSSTSNSDYSWTYPSISASNVSSCKCTVQAYLNHSDFTDTSAAYYVQLWQYTSVRIGYINQDKAPSGWSTISRSSITPPGGRAYSSTYSFVSPSGGSGKYTGADAIKVTITS